MERLRNLMRYNDAGIALSAVLWVSRMGSAQPATGKDWLITSFAVVAIVGGTGLSFAGGGHHRP